MRATIAVAVREVVAQRAFIGAAGVIAVLVFVAPAILGVGDAGAKDARGVTVLVLGAGFIAIAALLIGGTMIGKELAAGRSGFYLSRPIGGSSIFLGKLLGALVTVVACELVILAPLAGFHGWEDSDAMEGMSNAVSALNWGLIILLAAPLGAILLAHALGVMWRARTAWLALDIAALVISGLIGLKAYRMVEPRLEWIRSEPIPLLIGYGIALLVVLLIAGWVSIVRGRFDLRRTHASLSITLAVLLIVCAVCSIGFSRWLLRPRLDELVVFNGYSVSPAGEWLALNGRSTRMLPIHTSFLYNPASRVSESRFSRYPWSGDNVAFSGDGRRAAWLEEVGRRNFQLVIASLQEANVEIERTKLFFEDVSRLTLSPTGARIALHNRYHNSLYAVHEVSSGTLIASWRIPMRRDSLKPEFFSEGRLRLYVVDREPYSMDPMRTLRVFKLDLGKGRPQEVASVHLPYKPHSIEIDGARHRMVVALMPDPAPPSKWVVIETTAFQILFGIGFDDGLSGARVLSDGRIATWRQSGRRVDLVLLGESGEIDRILDLGPGEGARLGYQTAVGRLAIEVFHGKVDAHTWASSVLDLDLATGGSREIGRKLEPLSSVQAFGTVFPTPEPGALVSRCFRGPYDELMMWDPATGDLEQITPGHQKFGVAYRGASYWRN